MLSNSHWLAQMLAAGAGFGAWKSVVMGLWPAKSHEKPRMLAKTFAFSISFFDPAISPRDVYKVQFSPFDLAHPIRFNSTHPPQLNPSGPTQPIRSRRRTDLSPGKQSPQLDGGQLRSAPPRATRAAPPRLRSGARQKLPSFLRRGRSGSDGGGYKRRVVTEWQAWLQSGESGYKMAEVATKGGWLQPPRLSL
jgi:hypothetical protein